MCVYDLTDLAFCEPAFNDLCSKHCESRLICVEVSARQNVTFSRYSVHLISVLGCIAVICRCGLCYRPSSVVCLSVGLSRYWALQKRLNRSRCRLGVWTLVSSRNKY